MLLHYRVKVKTQNVILQWDITKENCIRCIIGSSKWTRVIMCLTLTYLGCYTAKRVWNKDSWYWWPAQTLDAILFWLWPEHHRCWRDHLRSCVPADGGCCCRTRNCACVLLCCLCIYHLNYSVTTSICSCMCLYTVGHKKELTYFCLNFVKNQRILI